MVDDTLWRSSNSEEIRALDGGSKEWYGGDATTEAVHQARGEGDHGAKGECSRVTLNRRGRGEVVMPSLEPAVAYLEAGMI